MLTVGKGQPTPWQRGAVEVLAAWAALRLRDQWTGSDRTEAGRLRERPPGSRLKEPSATLLRQALEALKMGSWEWDLATGEQVWDESTLTILGMEGESTKQTFETWTQLVHADDLPWLLVEIEQAIRNRRVSAVEYRICRSDGTAGWVSSRGRVLPGRTAGPPAWSARCGTPPRAGSPGTR